MPKMIKIGEIRVLNYFDHPWNEPWIIHNRDEVYIAEHICQVSKVYDYPRQMRGNPIKSAITVGKYEEFLFIQPSIDPFY